MLLISENDDWGKSVIERISYKLCSKLIFPTATSSKHHILRKSIDLEVKIKNMSLVNILVMNRHLMEWTIDSRSAISWVFHHYDTFKGLFYQFCALLIWEQHCVTFQP